MGSTPAYRSAGCLHAMSIGVERANMQLITQSPLSAWQPVAAKIGVTDRPAQALGG